jgi:hypothetical protein
MSKITESKLADKKSRHPNSEWIRAMGFNLERIFAAFPSLLIPQAVIVRNDMTLSAKIAAAVLREFVTGKDGIAHVTVDRLAELMGSGRKLTKRYLRELSQAGLLRERAPGQIELLWAGDNWESPNIAAKSSKSLAANRQEGGR